MRKNFDYFCLYTHFSHKYYICYSASEGEFRNSVVNFLFGGESFLGEYINFKVFKGKLAFLSNLKNWKYVLALKIGDIISALMYVLYLSLPFSLLLNVKSFHPSFYY